MAVLPRYPADNGADHHGVPAVPGGSNPVEDGPVPHRCDDGVLRAVAAADLLNMKGYSRRFESIPQTQLADCRLRSNDLLG